MDEPTAAISESEITRLFAIIKGLREKNVTVIYISHRLDEIFELGDYVTVMRDGRHIDTKPVSEIKDRSELIKMMIGKTVFEQYTPKEGECKDAILQVSNLSNHKLQGHLLRRPRGGDRRVLRPGGRGEDRACARHLRRGRLRRARSSSRGRSSRPLRTRQSRRGSPWCRRKDGRRGFSPSSPSAATCPS